MSAWLIHTGVEAATKSAMWRTDCSDSAMVASTSAASRSRMLRLTAISATEAEQHEAEEAHRPVVEVGRLPLEDERLLGRGTLGRERVEV